MASFMTACSAHRVSSSDKESNRGFTGENVSATLRIEPAEVRAGQTLQVLVQLEISGGHYLYASNTEPFIPVTVTLTLPPGLDAPAGWTISPAASAKGGHWVYTDSVQFRRTLRIGSNVPPGLLSIACELRYQACTEELCWPARTVPLSSPVRVRSSGR